MSKAIKEAKIEEVVETVEEVIERPYTLRKLNDGDLFPLLQLLRSLGLKDFKEAYLKNKGAFVFNPNDYASEEEGRKALHDMQKSAGIDVILDVAELMISKIDTHSEAIYSFFAGLSGISAEDIKKMEFGTLPLMIYDSFSEVKNTAFFKVLSKLL